ncbi:MAG TPA: hypothetical protein VNE40_00235 [Candidatus Dormibacteraeota bacterium]|nr:hypothetical protein [Candidatus Dormibacteraeota bacterium]
MSYSKEYGAFVDALQKKPNKRLIFVEQSSITPSNVEVFNFCSQTDGIKQPIQFEETVVTQEPDQFSFREPKEPTVLFFDDISNLPQAKL